jgi:hypothetical protein
VPDDLIKPIADNQYCRCDTVVDLYHPLMDSRLPNRKNPLVVRGREQVDLAGRKILTGSRQLNQDRSVALRCLSTVS